MSKITLARDEFKRLRSIIRRKGIRLLYYTNKDDFAGSKRSSAYTYSLEDPPLIVIRKGRGITYNELLYTILHEYGHVLDDQRYGTCARSKLYVDCTLETDEETIINYSAAAKYALLKTELIVENMIPKLWKRFNVRVPFDETKWGSERAVTIRVYKYWLIYGVAPAKTVIKKWIKEWKTKPWNADEAYIKDLSGV